MLHTAQSNKGHSARTSGSVCWQQYRAKTICLDPPPIRSSDPEHHIGGWPTTIVSVLAPALMWGSRASEVVRLIA